MFLTRAPLTWPKPHPFDLHVLSAPLTFVLSQDQTLQLDPYVTYLTTDALRRGTA